LPDLDVAIDRGAQASTASGLGGVTPRADESHTIVIVDRRGLWLENERSQCSRDTDATFGIAIMFAACMITIALPEHQSPFRCWQKSSLIIATAAHGRDFLYGEVAALRGGSRDGKKLK